MVGALMGSSSGGGLNPQQAAQLNAMLKATSAPPSSIPAKLLGVDAAPAASPFSTLAQNARMTLLQRQGYKATLGGGSPLGDMGFGKSVLRPGMPGTTALTGSFGG